MSKRTVESICCQRAAWMTPGTSRVEVPIAAASVHISSRDATGRAISALMTKRSVHAPLVGFFDLLRLDGNDLC
jgi:hypothetical protein